MVVLIGVALVVIGFALRLNPMLVVTVSGIVTALLGGLNPVAILDTFGSGFATNRSVTIYVITLPAIGLLERYGLQQQAARLIGKLRASRQVASWRRTCSSARARPPLGLTGMCGPPRRSAADLPDGPGRRHPPPRRTHRRPPIRKGQGVLRQFRHGGACSSVRTSSSRSARSS
ncbi:5-oxoproline transporter, DUF969 family subunit [Kutzneria kofuensis]|uniref:5-oxoproline transporter, DUF969 family subunit n=1 Tax=Kutzneria kofuensis TaxID=103725 RepID=UPI0031E962CB